jgi:hypothetical protein
MRHRTKVGANFTERNEFKVGLFLRIMCRLSRTSGSHKLLKPQGPDQACNATAYFSSTQLLRSWGGVKLWPLIGALCIHQKTDEQICKADGMITYRGKIE